MSEKWPNPEVAASLDPSSTSGSKVAGTLAKRMAKEYSCLHLTPASSKPTRSAAILSFAALRCISSRYIFGLAQKFSLVVDEIVAG
jgi:hypothetical protein